ncbi:5-formyltetrahydrofolate cyclo-ligase family protein [Stieleria neptunia]|uniref:5-formyltetrahydrofolate cyclo-ligase n=1 Tax=Stieleria neptunia TaxID=2527979 RepID=A0A518HZH0_9BACT|nr:5-formyltetrahydrofolate cyclo-ligase [Stieleria neptunia]QDV46251.1 5-formyltetrahydrofolate cyclo-ligase family protein [Stieleria neptunia]
MGGPRKASIRRATAAARRDQGDKERLSRQITDRLQSMPQYAAAGCVLWYVHVRDEVRTEGALRGALQETPPSDRKIVVPYCVGEDLHLFDLRGWDDLSPGAFGILEPRAERRGGADRSVAAAELDLIVVPGVAFDPKGGRLGHGRGFYDRLLARVRAETVLVGVAFECQIVPHVPLDDHDVSMDWVVTEQRLIDCEGGPRVRAGDEHW